MPRILIAGCGFVGLATARLLLSRGWEVTGFTSSEASAASLAGEAFPVVACDIAQRSSVEARAGLGPFEAVVHCASSGRGGAEDYRRVYLQGAENLAAVFAPKLLVFTSSTSVYAQTDGSWVTEESPAEPERGTGRLLRETEDFVAGHHGIVARLSGIYGPGRAIMLRRFLEGTATIEGDGAKWTNQVHRDDIAAALVHLITCGARGTFNVTDDRPLTQQELYAWLARHFKRPLPPSGPMVLDRKRGWTSKRVSNAKLRALGWTPRFVSLFDAIVSDPELLHYPAP